MVARSLPYHFGVGLYFQLLSVVCAALLFSSSIAMAAGPVEEVFVLSAKDLESSYRGRVALPLEWRFSPIDDPSNGEVEVDDRRWKRSQTHFPDGETPPEWQGLGWFRLHFRADPSIRQVPLELHVVQAGAAEIYLDGRRIAAIGKLHADPDQLVERINREPLLIALDDREDHVLAVRFAVRSLELGQSTVGTSGFALAIGEANTQVAEHLDRVRMVAGFQAFFAGIFGAFALLHLLLFVFYVKGLENLFFALFSASVAILVFLILHQFSSDDPWSILLANRIADIARLEVSFFGLLFAAAIFGNLRSWQVKVAAALAVLAGLASWFYQEGAGGWVLIAGLVMSVEMVRLVAVAALGRRRGARLIGIGIFGLAAGMTTGLLAEQGFLSVNLFTAFLIPFGSVLVLIGTMSVSLSRRFAATRRELQFKLEEVQELSTAKLEQERRAHDEAVQRALVEADYRRKLAELEGARRLQLSMLPESVPQLPELEIAALMQTATEVGGDYYDFAVDDDGTFAVAVGDATGHGMMAGTMVTATKSLFNAFSGEADLSATLGRFTSALKRMNLRRLRMALTLVTIKSGVMKIAAAGMPPALIHRAATGEVEMITIAGMPLGSWPEDFAYRQQELLLAPGDTVLLMSDGFPERINDQEEVLGYEKAVEAFSEAALAPCPADVIERLIAEQESWANGEPAADDTTFVVLRVREPSTQVAH